MQDPVYTQMIQARGSAYRSDQTVAHSHYREPVDHCPGRLAGNSRVWGDARPEVQSRVIDELIASSREAGLNPRETAHVLAIARVESGFNPDAAAGTTSASGLGQFIDRTGNAYGLNGRNRLDVGVQSDALVAHFIDNRNLAQSRGQGEEYIYKYHHDGPRRDYGGLGLSTRKVQPYLDDYEQFVRQRLQLAPSQNSSVLLRAEAATAEQLASGSFNQVMGVMLPHQRQTRPHVTGEYGEHWAKGNHGGVDFNYIGGQQGINKAHPTVHAPTSGAVTFVGGNYGTVKIKNAQGNSHEILHTRTQQVRVGQQIEQGDPIGSMGSRGPGGHNDYAWLVHYQLHNPHGKIIDPVTFWSRQSLEAIKGEDAIKPASQDGVLVQGEKGREVAALQEQLNRLRYGDGQGDRLATDGDFGARTEFALRAYQRANGLTEDGIAGPQTLGALQKASRVPQLSEATHPNHAMYAQAVNGLEQLGPQAFKNRQELENAAGALVFDARVSGMARIDHVLANSSGSGLFAVQGGLNNPVHLRIYINKEQAVQQPVEQSGRQLQQENLNQSQNDAQQVPQEQCRTSMMV